MTRVLVVGTNNDGEQTLLDRLQDMAGLPDGSLSPCRDPGQCDVLIVRDSPGLRSAAQRMHQGRPEMRLWVEDSQGMLRDGGDQQLPLLRRDDIVSVLAGEGQPQRGSAQVIQMPLSEQALARMQQQNAAQAGVGRSSDQVPVQGAGESVVETAAANVEDAPHWQVQAARVSGATDLTRRLRQGIHQRTGYALFQSRGHVMGVVDFANGQAIVPAEEGVSGLAETAQWLGRYLADMSLEDISAEHFHAFDTRGQRMPLRALLWQCAGQFEQWDKLDAKLAAGALIHLDGWPDFRVLARQQDIFRLCSLLVKRACSLSDCCVMLELSPATVQQFVHSAFLSGYARLESVAVLQGGPTATDGAAQTEPLASSTGSKVGGLLARMWRSVRGAARGQ